MVDFEEYDKVIKKAREIGVRKNRQYGDESLRSFKGIAMLARAKDKMARIEKMVDDDNDGNMLDIHDDILDIINYMVYYYIYIEGKL